MQPHWKAALVAGTAILALTADALAQNPPQSTGPRRGADPHFTTRNSFPLNVARSSGSR